jgi:hypothetical protein
MFNLGAPPSYVWSLTLIKKSIIVFIAVEKAVRSEKTNKRLPLNLEDSMRHECAVFYSVNNRAGRAQGKQLFFGK